MFVTAFLKEEGNTENSQHPSVEYFLNYSTLIPRNIISGWGSGIKEELQKEIAEQIKFKRKTINKTTNRYDPAPFLEVRVLGNKNEVLHLIYVFRLHP